MSDIFRTSAGLWIAIMLGALVAVGVFLAGYIPVLAITAGMAAAALCLTIGRDIADRSDRIALAEELRALHGADSAAIEAARMTRDLVDQSVEVAESALRAANVGDDARLRPIHARLRELDGVGSQVAGLGGRIAALEDTTRQEPDMVARDRIAALEARLNALLRSASEQKPKPEPEPQTAPPAQNEPLAPPALEAKADAKPEPRPHPAPARIPAPEPEFREQRARRAPLQPPAFARRRRAAETAAPAPILALADGETAFLMLPAADPAAHPVAQTRDLAALEAARALAATLGPAQEDVDFIAPISAESLADKTFLTALAQFLVDAPELRGRLGLSTTQAALSAARRVRAPLSRIPHAGAFVALREIEDWRLDLGLLAECGCRLFVVDPDAVRDQGAADGGDPARLARALEKRGIALLATGLDDAGRLASAERIRARYGVGAYLTERRS